VAIVVLSAVVFPVPPAHAETEAAGRVVKYSKEDIVPVHAKLRFSTLIVLPEDEEILDFTTGDKNSGSSTAHTTSATFTRPRLASAAISI